MPKLVFDDKFDSKSSDMEKEINKYKFVNAIFHVLLLHKGLISELCICIQYTEIVNEIDPIILQLSLSKNIKKFIFEVYTVDGDYKLPCSFFSFQGLEHLSLTYCKFELPLMFNGFSMLKSLVFYQVKITANMLQRFLIGCPLLEEFTLIEVNQIVLTECELVELFQCLHSIQVLEISQLYIEHLDAGLYNYLHKLPIPLPHLRILVFEVCFLELSNALCVISSCPNLEKIKLKMCWNHNKCDPFQQTFNNLPDIQDYSDLINLDHLREMEITNFRDCGSWMEFVKLIMAKSPVLKKARIVLRYDVSADEEIKMLRDLMYLPLPRASPAGKFIMERPKKYYWNANYD